MAPGTPSLKNRILSALRVCLTAGGMTALILMAVFALRGIWPFGADNVAYVDTAQFYVPDYYKLWDALHGRISMNVNWFAGLAEGSSASFSDFLKPANWVFFFVSRDHVLEGLSLFLVVRMVFIAFGAALALNLRFPALKTPWQAGLALLYTFSGFTLQYYANFFWLGYAAMFPFMLYALEQLLRDGKYVLYALIYGYYLYTSVYFTYMITIYILLFSFLYCALLLPRPLRNDRILRLGLSTAAAFGITARSWLGASASLAGTSRFQDNMDSGLITGLSTWNIPNTRHTFLMLMGMALAAALLIRALARQKRVPSVDRPRRKRVILFFACMLGLLFIPMVFTNIDAAWHFGQYNFFPMRYGFAVPATLLAAAALALGEEEALPAPAARRGEWLWLAPIALALIPVGKELLAIFREYGACFLQNLGAAGYFRWFGLYILCGLLFTGLYLLLFRMKNRRAAQWLTAGALLLQIGANACGHVAPSDDHVFTREYDPAYIETADSLYEYFSDSDISPLSRAKNVDNSLNAGYPAIAGVSAVSSVASDNSAARLGVFRELGYTVNYCRVLDTGGTVFSDMLMGVDYILSARPLDESLYIPGDTAIDGVNIGRALYPGAVGLMYDEAALADYFTYDTLPGRLNALYRAFTGSQGTLAAAVTPAISAAGDGMKTYTLTCTLDRPSFLYMAADAVLLNITAGGEPVAVPSYQNLDNTVYPAAFNSNLLYLGCFEGAVDIRFSCATELAEAAVSLTALDKAALDSFYSDAALAPHAVTGYSDDGLTLTVTADRAGRRLFLPLCQSSRWRCTVNGRVVDPATELGVLMGIPLEAGVNEISLVRGPVPLRVTPGLICSAVCLVLAAAWLLFRRGERLRALTVPQPVYTLAGWAFAAAAAAVFCFVYLSPLALLLFRGGLVWF